MKILWLVVCAATLLAACGSSGNGSSLNNVTMQGGQWEFAVGPDNDPSPLYLDMNLPATNGPISGSAVIYNSAVVGISGADAPIYCEGFKLNGSIAQATLKGNLIWGQATSNFATITGSLASDGKSVPKGSYSGQMCLDTTSPQSDGPQVTGVLTGYTVSPVNGTFKGTLQSSLHGSAIVTLSIVQNPDFTLTVSGSAVENGITSTLVPAAGPLAASVLGGIVSIGGLANNINDSNPFAFSGHLNSGATQITITSMNIGSNEYFTGALTQQ